MKNESRSIAAAGNPAQLSLPFECERMPCAAAVRDRASEASPEAPATSPPDIADQPSPAPAADGATAHVPNASDTKVHRTGSSPGEAEPPGASPCALVPTGKDPNHVRDLTEQILGNASSTVLDRIVASGIARSSATRDLLWEDMMDARACYREDTARALAAGDMASGNSSSQLSLERQLNGRTLIAHHTAMTKHLQMHSLAQATCNKAIAAYDTRKLNALKAMLAALKVGCDD